MLSPMRRTLRQWLEALGAVEAEVYDVLVAVTEAAANAVEHAYGPDATRPSTSRRARATTARCTMTSCATRAGGVRRAGITAARGTLLMQELMDHFEVMTGEEGTEVRMRRRLERAGGASV